VITFKRFVREAVLPQQQQAQAQAPTQGGGRVTQTPGAVRNLPLSQALVNTIERGLAGTGLNWHSYSGGQPPLGSGGRRVGSTRHDNGRASDGNFKDASTGQVLNGNNQQDRQRIATALGRLRQVGIQGIGWGPGYMGTRGFHIDIVSPANVWGEGGRSANAHSWVRQAAGGSVAPPVGGANSDSGEGDSEEEGEGGQPPEPTEYESPMQALAAMDQAFNTVATYGSRMFQ
jgi:hypothetical protein